MGKRSCRQRTVVVESGTVTKADAARRTESSSTVIGKNALLERKGAVRINFQRLADSERSTIELKRTGLKVERIGDGSIALRQVNCGARTFNSQIVNGQIATLKVGFSFAIRTIERQVAVNVVALRDIDDCGVVILRLNCEVQVALIVDKALGLSRFAFAGRQHAIRSNSQ